MRMAPVLALSLVLGGVAFVAATANRDRAGIKNRRRTFPQPTIDNPNPPSDVTTSGATPLDQLPDFDDYSWRMFLAMVWPAQAGSRGVADATKGIDDPGPRVFETYKASWEIFHKDGSAPAPWSVFDGSSNPCEQTPSFTSLDLGSYSKFSNLVQQIRSLPPIGGPIVSQNGWYVMNLSGFNQVEFDQITAPDHRWYLFQNLGNVSFPAGSIDVKSSWINMAGVANPGSFYTRQALVLVPGTTEVVPMTVGLVGLHIVQKTPTRSQWIWSTFEHTNLVPDSPTDRGPFVLHDATQTSQPASDPLTLTNLIVPPITPVTSQYNINRSIPINGSTQSTNALYQAAIKQRNAQSVWQNYRLVMTQFPLQPGSTADGNPTNTFPGVADYRSAFANVTMESFEQGNVGTSCMACHNNSGQDFVYTVLDHAYPPDPNLPLRRLRYRKLIRILSQARSLRAKGRQ